MAADALGVAVESVEYRAFETDREYRDALVAEIAANLDPFNADSATEAMNNYLGSSLEVLD